MQRLLALRNAYKCCFRGGERVCKAYVCRRSSRRKGGPFRRSFVGAAGKLFDKYLAAVGINREDVYIANILKCRPPKNRDPKPEEEDICMEYLRGQVRAIRPKMIVCLGRIAAARLIKPDFKITQEHGVWFNRGQFEICAVYHPSALLRDPHKKDAMLADMLAIKAKLDEME